VIGLTKGTGVVSQYQTIHAQLFNDTQNTALHYSVTVVLFVTVHVIAANVVK